MHRLNAIAILTLSLACTGCFFNRQAKEEKEGWGPKQWREAKREDELRLMSEDERAKLDAFHQVDVAKAAVWDQFKRIYYTITGKSPFNAAKAMVDPKETADRRRQGVVWLSDRDYGRQQPYLRYYQQLARNAPEQNLRAMAIRALSRARDESATSIFIEALKDRSELVRLEAAKALANIPEPLAQRALIQRVADAEEANDVRVAAADALRSYRNAETAQALIRVLRDRNFGVSWQARRSLRLMTGQDYRYDPAAWLTYLADAEKPFG